MAPSDAHALATAVAGAVGDGVRRVEGVHRAITARSWRWVGALGRPSQAVHDAVSGVAYAAVGVGVVAGGAVAAQTLDLLARSRRWGDLSASPSGAAALAVLDALAGDQLERQGSPLAVPMSVRARAGGPPLADGAALAEADVSGEIVLFVHGLAGWEGGWWTGAAGASGAAHADPDGAADRDPPRRDPPPTAARPRPTTARPRSTPCRCPMATCCGRRSG